MDDDDLLLVAYVDGELDPIAMRKVEALIAADQRARETMEMFRDTAAILRAACGEEFYRTSDKVSSPFAPSLACLSGVAGAKHQLGTILRSGNGGGAGVDRAFG